ncbi:hypothetical protein D3C80_2135590 [compost metagenome]
MIEPIIEPDRLRRAPTRPKAFTGGTAPSGMPTMTMLPSTFSRLMYWFQSIAAPTVQMIKSNVPASLVNVSASLVA